MKSRVLSLCVLLNCIVTFVVCSLPSYIAVNVQHPASIDLPHVKEIAIADFRGPERSGSQVATLLQSMLIAAKHFDIMERDKLRRILEEQNLGMSGIVDETTAAEIGSMLGVDALLFGEVTMYEVEDKEIEKTVKERRGTGKYRTVEEKDEKTGEVKKVQKEIYEEVYVPKKYWVRLGNVAINFRVVDVESGVLLAAHSESKSYDSEKDRSFLEKISDTRNLKPKADILNGLSSDICKKFSRTIAPYYTSEKRTIEPGPGSIGVGVKYAEEGLWPEAMESWQQATIDFPEESAGFYNLGLANEVQGMLDKAESWYKDALDIKNKRLYMEALARIRKAKEEQARLRMQREGRGATER